MVIFHGYVSLPEGKPPFSYGFPMVFLWFSYGFPIKTSIFPMVSLWFPHVKTLILRVTTPIKPVVAHSLVPPTYMTTRHRATSGKALEGLLGGVVLWCKYIHLGKSLYIYIYMV